MKEENALATSQKEILILAIYAAEIMVRNGSETYRVEDTILRICKSEGLDYVEALVTPTGILVSIDQSHSSQHHMLTFNKRIQHRQINLEKVSEVNDFSRRFVVKEMSVEEGMKRLREIDNKKPPYRISVQALFGGVASGFFVLLIGANFMEFLTALLSTILMTFVLGVLIKRELSYFFAHLTGGMIAASLAILASNLHPDIRVNIVIIGGIMVMVPGVAITNGLRDTVAGDLMSGIIRGVEALVIAVSIAFGVGFVLNVWNVAQRFL
ncbi:threonine/serine exporter family protein [Isachenkonia alkalipeptolytica]|uniref:Threonine/serine exporter family protein n=2 Tax=Isachenkonia alkalipeptolytica TaxID=2565777 RepID=A0AA44BEY1_9CLOT|nr:threonine/serine exporter family protein [Isachenkonia alkalipeptolytica]